MAKVEKNTGDMLRMDGNQNRMGHQVILLPRQFGCTAYNGSWQGRVVGGSGVTGSYQMRSDEGIDYTGTFEVGR